MIDFAEVEALAFAFPETTHVLLHGHTHVWKVRGKVFGVFNEADGLTFKATEIAYAVLTEEGPGRRAPGFPPGRWVSMPLSEINREEAADWLASSWRTVAAALPKAQRQELGIA